MKVKRGLVALLSGALLMMPWAVAAASAPPTVSSLSAVVYEPQSGRVLYEKDGRTARPMASTTKLMTALLATELLDMESIVQVPSGAVPVEGTQLGLAVGESISVRDLLAGLLLSSGNDAANALALLMDDSLPAFAQRMNARAAALGMTDSLFVTPSGLDQGGHSASARDMALLGAAVLQKPSAAELCAAKTATVTIGGRRMTISNHNKLLRLYEGCIGLKTGFTKKSGRCLVSAATQNGVTLVIATLNGGDYWNDHMALYKYAFSLVRQEPLSPPILPPVAVAGPPPWTDTADSRCCPLTGASARGAGQLSGGTARLLMGAAGCGTGDRPCDLYGRGASACRRAYPLRKSGACTAFALVGVFVVPTFQTITGCIVIKE